MKNFFVAGIMSMLALVASAQTLTVSDAETGKPIEYATIHSKNPEAFVTTNAKGQADISAFKGSVLIEIRSVGFKPIKYSYEELQSMDFKVKMNFSVIDIDEFVVSASRWNQSTSDVPARVITISPSEIALQNPQTAADLLAASGAVFVQKSQQGGGSPMIRGFATNRLIYSVDGVRMNTAIFRGGNIQNVISLDPFAIESAEVLFGPGSVIYGSDAIGGVMSFTTLVPELSLSDTALITGKAVARYSSANGEMSGHFDVNVGWKKWAVLSSFSTNNYGDLRMGAHGPDDYLRPFYVQRQDSADVMLVNRDPRIQVPTGYSQINMMQKIRFRPNEKWDFQYGFHYSETSDYSRYDRHIRYRNNGMPRYGEFSYGPQIWMMNNLSISHTSSGKLYDQMNIKLAQQYFEESRISRDFNQNNRETRTEEVDAYSVNVDFAKSLGKKNKFFYGFEYVRNDVHSVGVDEDISTGTKTPGAARYPQSQWSSAGVYINNQWKVSDKFLLQAGARFNSIKLGADFDTTFYPFPFTRADLNHSALNGSLGAVFRPNEKLVISANLSTGFRAPNVDDIGKVFDSEAGSVVVPNPGLESEYAYSADLGIAKVFGEFAKIEINGFYTMLQNALVRRNYTLNGLDSIMYDGTLSRVQAIQNAATANVYGAQLAVECKLGGGFTLAGNLNFQKGEEELDDASTSPSRHAAPLFGALRLGYSDKKLSMQFYTMYSAAVLHKNMPVEEIGKPELYAKDENGNPWSPSWYTLNFKALYKVTDYFSVSAGLENISDQRYRPYSSGLTAAGRNFILSFRANF